MFTRKESATGKKNPLHGIKIKDVEKEIEDDERDRAVAVEKARQIQKKVQRFFKLAATQDEYDVVATKREILNNRYKLKDLESDIMHYDKMLEALHKVRRILTRASKMWQSTVLSKVFQKVSQEDLMKWLVDEKQSEDQVLDKLQGFIDVQTDSEMESRVESDPEMEAIDSQIAAIREAMEKTGDVDTAVNSVLERDKDKEHSEKDGVI